MADFKCPECKKNKKESNSYLSSIYSENAGTRKQKVFNYSCSEGHKWSEYKKGK